MSSGSLDGSVDALNALAATAISLLQQLEAVLHDINTDKDQADSSPSSQPQSTVPVDSLSVAHDSASLIKAHSTKISVLIINEPFTPSAISKVLRELVTGPIPGLTSAVQSCEAARYTATFRRDLAWRCYTVLKELRELIQKIPKDGKMLSAAQKNGSAFTPGKGSIIATGVIWAACDEVVRFSKAGVAGCFVKKVEEYRDTLKDVMEELKEWAEESADDDENEGGDDTEDLDSGLGSMHISTQEMIDDLMDSHRSIPHADPDRIRDRLDSCLKRLRLTTLLCQAIIKRRLKVLPQLPAKSSSAIPQRLDEVMRVLKMLPSRFDELAGAFYELSPQEIDRVMDQSFFDVFALSELLMQPWEAQRDEFTDWAEKFQVQIKKG